MSVLHVIPDSVVDPRHFYLGSTKDIAGRTEYFQYRGIKYDRIIVRSRSDAFLLEALKSHNLAAYTSAIIEYPVFPRSLSYIRENAPHIRLFTRSHNAELYHRLHWALARSLNARSLVDLRAIFVDIGLSLARLRLDYVCGKRSDAVLSISRWEIENYWKYLTVSSKVWWLPTFSPRVYEHVAIPILQKKRHCVCLMSTAPNPLLMDAAWRFSRLIGELNDSYEEWTFSITGDFPANNVSLSERIRLTGYLQTPYPILAEARAVAILSDYGFGFKTKLLDAIAHKCFILVTMRLFRRLPSEVQPYCIVVDTNSVESFKAGLQESLRPYPSGNPNEVFRDQAFATLDALLRR